MRISDWSSDVCSSDLALEAERAATDLAAAEQAEEARRVADKAEREAAKADKTKAHASGGSRAIGLRTYYTAELVDPVAALKHYKQAQPEALKARSEEHTELQSLMRISYAVFCLKKKTQKRT